MKADQVLPTRVRNAERGTAKVQVPDDGMTHVCDSWPITHIRTLPQFAESCTEGRQFVDMFPHARVIQSIACHFPQPANGYLNCLVPIDEQLSRLRIRKAPAQKVLAGSEHRCQSTRDGIDG